MSGSEDDRDDFEPRAMMQGKIFTFTDAGQLWSVLVFLIANVDVK